ncbi:MAG TPA: cation:proton antiporter [Candidatus Paceibacterota bacterium]
MSLGIFELATVFLIAASLAILARILRQPLLVAYVATGALISYFGAFDLINQETFRLFADLGVMFLLFLVGMEVNYSSLRLVGRTALVIGVCQIIFTSGFGYFIAKTLSFPTMSAIYIGLALTFSSTIIIIKLLSEKKDLHSLYGKITIGFMLVQDACAIMLLVLLSGITKGGTIDAISLGLTILKAVALFGSMIWLGKNVFPKLFDRLAYSQELFFLVATAWVFLIAAFVYKLGFSIEIGGFLAGVSLAGSSEHFALGTRIKTLRDFFILIFFVVLGSTLVGLSFSGLVLPIIVLSIFVLIGNPFIVLCIMGLLGYRRKTSFLAGVTVAQVSEFSLILVALGVRVGHIGSDVVALVTAVAVITIIISTYIITHGEHIAKRLHKLLRFFERKHLVENNIPDDGFHKPIVFIGVGRIGKSILRHLPLSEVLIIDYDPDIIRDYRTRGYSAILGSVVDEDILEAANLDEAKLIISTSPDLEDNLSLLEYLARIGSGAKVILRAETEREASILYEAGTTYVIFPHLSAGHLLGKHIAEHPDMTFFNILRKNDIATLAKSL